MTGELFRNRARADSFGAIAQSYDRARPSYPEAMLLDLLMLDPHDVLDVGCGTGKVARGLLDRHLNVLGVEPDDGMAAVARANGVTVETAPFETWDDEGRRFDLLVCGQAWHWIDPAIGPRRAFEVLRPGGTTALFWNVPHTEAQLREQMDAIYARLAPQLASDRLPRGSSRADDAAVPAGLTAAGFESVGTREYGWSRRYSRDEWLELLFTFSDHALLPSGLRSQLAAELGGLADARGGPVELGYTTLVVSGRRPGR